MDALRGIMLQEEEFILRSPESRRILIDLYETNLTNSMMAEFIAHIVRLSSRIVKLAIAGDKKCIKQIYKALVKEDVIAKGLIYICTDMEEGKTWLVSDSF